MYSDDDSDDDDDEEEASEEEPQSRARDLLANFYGKLHQGEHDEEDTPGYAKMPAIDRSDFDADVYVREMLETQKLPALLEQDDSLCRDIKSLSGDMQMLVYENYSKFIAATDTIRDMKKNVSAMESEMSSLNVTMAEIDGMSESVNASLADKRSKIDKLVRARRLLKRLEFLFELPRRLSAAAQAKRYKEAVRYYAMTEEILRRYDRVPSLREIHRECRRIASKLKTSLRASLDSKDEDDVAVRVELLVQLGADPLDCERAAFSACFANLGGKLKAALDSLAPDASAPKVAASIASDVTPAFVVAADALNQVADLVTKNLAKKKAQQSEAAVSSSSSSKQRGGGDLVGEKDDADDLLDDDDDDDDDREKDLDESLAAITVLHADEASRPSFDELALGLFADYVDAVERTLDVAVAKERAALASSAAAEAYVDAARALEVAGDAVETAAAKCGVGDLLRMKLQRVGRRAAARRLEDSMTCAKAAVLRSIVDLATRARTLVDDPDEEDLDDDLKIATTAEKKQQLLGSQKEDSQAQEREEEDEEDGAPSASPKLPPRGESSSSPSSPRLPPRDGASPKLPPRGSPSLPPRASPEEPPSTPSLPQRPKPPPRSVRVASRVAARAVAAAAQAGLDRAAPLLEHLDDVDVEDCATDFLAFVKAAISAAGDAYVPEAKATRADEEPSPASPALTAADDDEDHAAKNAYDRSKILDAPTSVAALAEACGGVDCALERDSTDEKRVLAVGAMARALLLSTYDDKDDADDFFTAKAADLERKASRGRPRLALSDLLDGDVLRATAGALFSRYARLVSAKALRGNKRNFFVFGTTGVVPPGAHSDDDDDSQQGTGAQAGSGPTPALVEAVRALDAASADFGAAVGDATVAERLDLDDLLASLREDLDAASAAVAKPDAARARSVGGIELDVERLFARRDTTQTLGESLGPANDQWTADTLAATLFKNLARSLVEHVRRVTVPRAAHYAQLDLDSRFLLAAFDQRLNNPDATKDLERLISAFLQSASDRCLED